MVSFTEEFATQLASFNPQLAGAIAQNSWLLPLIILQVILKIVLYPIALYVAGKNKKKLIFTILFLCLIIINDLGIIPLVYLIFNKYASNKSKQKKK